MFPATMLKGVVGYQITAHPLLGGRSVRAYAHGSPAREGFATGRGDAAPLPLPLPSAGSMPTSGPVTVPR